MSNNQSFSCSVSDSTYISEYDLSGAEEPGSGHESHTSKEVYPVGQVPSVSDEESWEKVTEKRGSSCAESRSEMTGSQCADNYTPSEAGSALERRPSEDDNGDYIIVDVDDTEESSQLPSSEVIVASDTPPPSSEAEVDGSGRDDVAAPSLRSSATPVPSSTECQGYPTLARSEISNFQQLPTETKLSTESGGVSKNSDPAHSNPTAVTNSVLEAELIAVRSTADQGFPSKSLLLAVPGPTTLSCSLVTEVPSRNLKTDVQPTVYGRSGAFTRTLFFRRFW